MVHDRRFDVRGFRHQDGQTRRWAAHAVVDGRAHGGHDGAEHAGGVRARSVKRQIGARLPPAGVFPGDDARMVGIGKIDVRPGAAAVRRVLPQRLHVLARIGVPREIGHGVYRPPLVKRYGQRILILPYGVDVVRVDMRLGQHGIARRDRKQRALGNLERDGHRVRRGGIAPVGHAVVQRHRGGHVLLRGQPQVELALDGPALVAAAEISLLHVVAQTDLVVVDVVVASRHRERDGDAVHIRAPAVGLFLHGVGPVRDAGSIDRRILRVAERDGRVRDVGDDRRAGLVAGARQGDLAIIIVVVVGVARIEGAHHMALVMAGGARNRLEPRAVVRIVALVPLVLDLVQVLRVGDLDRHALAVVLAALRIEGHVLRLLRQVEVVRRPQGVQVQVVAAAVGLLHHEVRADGHRIVLAAVFRGPPSDVLIGPRFHRRARQRPDLLAVGHGLRRRLHRHARPIDVVGPILAEAHGDQLGRPVGVQMQVVEDAAGEIVALGRAGVQAARVHAVFVLLVGKRGVGRLRRPVLELVVLAACGLFRLLADALTIVHAVY